MKTWKTEKGTKVSLVCSGRSNVYLVSGRSGSFLVDAGMSWSRLEILARVAMAGADAPKPSALVLTHTHFDHAGSAAAVKERYGLKIIVHKNDVGYLAAGDSPLPRGTIPYTKALIAAVGKPVQRLSRYASAVADIAVDDVYSLDFTGIDARVISTPGHTAGSISVIVDDEIAIVGDAMYGMSRRSVFSPFADDQKMLFASIRKLYDTGCRLYLSGHGPAIDRSRVEAAVSSML